jgi:hypothetical protein
MMSHVREHEAPANLCSRRLPDHAVADPERSLGESAWSMLRLQALS